MRFSKKTALITGGGTGIGAAVARRIRSCLLYTSDAADE